MKHAMLVLLLSLAAATAAGAEPTRAERREARRLFEQGVEAVGREDYVAALAAFEESNRLSPRAVTLFNIGMCQRALADLPAALHTLQQYLETAADDARARVEEARRVVAEIDAVLARVTVRADRAEAELLVDGLPAGRGAVTRPLRLMAGTHVFEAHLEGRTVREVVDIAPAEAVEVQLEFGPAPAAVPSSEEPAEEEGGSSIVEAWWFWTVIGAVVAGGAITAGVLLAPGEEPLAADWTIEGN
ncbi:MAG: hypothetical protein GYA57_08620 [Myxococcales bacterium]|nr:hypothetical protein [Myxococcales bacterium]